MKFQAKYSLIFVALISIIQSELAYSRDDVTYLSVKDALSTSDAKAKIHGGVKFFFGKSKHPKIKQHFGSRKANRKTNAFNKTDLEACNWAFLSAMIALQSRAMDLGGNAVVNIKSVYKNRFFESDDKFECGAGNIVAGVALKGDIVKL